jgi:hypothetical protein
MSGEQLKHFRRTSKRFGQDGKNVVMLFSQQTFFLDQLASEMLIGFDPVLEVEHLQTRHETKRARTKRRVVGWRR